MTKLSPIVSEFETTEQADAYERWLRGKVAVSLADARSPVPHDEAMARVQLSRHPEIAAEPIAAN